MTKLLYWLVSPALLFARSVSRRLATTRIGGHPAHMKQEGFFPDMFDNTKTYEVRGDTLTITAEDGGRMIAGRM